MSSIVPGVNLQWVLSGARGQLCDGDVSAVVSLTTELGEPDTSWDLRVGHPHHVATDGQTPILVEEVGCIPNNGMFDSIRSEDANGLRVRGSEHFRARYFVEFLCRFFL